MDQRAMKMAMARKMAGRPMALGMKKGGKTKIKKGVKKMNMGGYNPMSGGSGAPLQFSATPGAAPVAATGFTGGIGSMAAGLGSGLRAAEGRPRMESGGMGMRRMAGGGSVGSASRRADGIAQRGKTRGKYV